MEDTQRSGISPQRIGFILIGLFFLLGITILFASLIPYYWYCRAITTGINLDLLKFHPDGRSLILPMKELQFSVDSANAQDHLWETLHFSHVMIPFPGPNSSIDFSPYIESKDRRGFWKSQRPKIGLEYHQNNRRDLLARLVLQEEMPFKFHLDEQKLFQLPVVKNHILQTNNQRIWKDLFTLDLKLSEDPHFDYLHFLSYYRFGWLDLSYRLFIYHLRRIYFPAGVNRFCYYGKTNLGIMFLLDGQRLVEQKIFMLENGKLFSFLITNRKDLKVVTALVQAILQGLTYRASGPQSSMPLYNRYKELAYDQQMANSGLKYFYAAWSHNVENEDFTKALIQYVEKGKQVNYFITPFYDYALKTYGSNLSSKEVNFQYETLEKRIPIKSSLGVSQTPTATLAGESPIQVQGEVEGEGEADPRARAESLLEEVKEQGFNSDSEEAVILVD